MGLGQNRTRTSEPVAVVVGAVISVMFFELPLGDWVMQDADAGDFALDLVASFNASKTGR